MNATLLLLFSHPVVSVFCEPMDCSTPGLPVPHRLLEFAQVRVHCISDAVQPSHDDWVVEAKLDVGPEQQTS